MKAKGSSSAASAATASVLDNLNSSYDSVYAQGTLQTKYVRKLVSRLTPGSAVLDVGCATGVLNGVLMEQAGLNITGFDVSEKMIGEATKNVPTGTFYKADAKYFAPATQYDAVVCSLALSMEPKIWSYSLAFKIPSWLKPNGILLFGTIDFNEFPVAPGCPVDPTGLTFYHTFMGTTIKDSTLEVGEWVTILRRAGLRLDACEQRKFDPEPGHIEPESQCFFLASKTGRNALLGPHSHPYKHYPISPIEFQASRSSLMGRRVFDTVHSPSTPITWKINLDQLNQECPIGVKRLELDWLLGAATTTKISSAVRACLAQNSAIEKVVLVQASPSNHAIEVANSVARFLGLGTQHHGALISDFLSGMGLSGVDERVQIELLPATLDFTDIASSAFLHEAARLFADVWFSAEKDKNMGLVKQMIETRLRCTLDEFTSLGQTTTGTIGFDCISVTINVGMRRAENQT
jgi:SAM-dependent methyltransferase